MPSLSGSHDGRRILVPIAVLGSDKPLDLTFVQAVALVDTGATVSAIGARLISALGLEPYAKRPLMVATEERLVDFYIYRIGLFPDFEGSRPSAAILPFVFADIEGFGMRSSDRFEAIIGMDVLSQCDFAISKDRTWTLTFG